MTPANVKLQVALSERPEILISLETTGCMTCLQQDMGSTAAVVIGYLAASLLVQRGGGEGKGVSVVLQLAGLEIEVGSSPLVGQAGEVQHALLWHHTLATMLGTHCQAHLQGLNTCYCQPVQEPPGGPTLTWLSTPASTSDCQLRCLQTLPN